MAFHGSVAALEPTLAVSLNELPCLSTPPSKKRKTSHDCEPAATRSLPNVITIEPCGASLGDAPRKLTPITLLPRSRLPLFWLDSAPNPLRSIQPGRFFTANILALEIELQERQDPVVLATRLQKNKSIPAGCDTFEAKNSGSEELYVVERVKRGIYAVCPLAPSVGEGDLVVAAKGWKREDHAIPHEPGLPAGQGDWFERAKISETFCEPATALSDVELGSERVVSSVKGAHDVNASDRPNYQEPSASIELASLYDAVNQGHGNPQQTSSFQDSPNPREILDNLRTRYLDTLYTSQTSVAYFAKGQLSRARAAFQSANDAASMRILDLCYFYRECILPIKRMDTKYRDSIPKIVRDLSINIVDGGKSERKNAKKRKKLGRNGLYSDEEDFISKWWRGRNVTEAPGSLSGDGELKRLVAELRFRETQLQILLILETISLEASAANLSSDKAQDSETRNPVPNKDTKKKPQDLNMLLELLVDRLCIWYTVGSHDVATVENTKALKQEQAAGKAGNDKLRDFCTEVIIPFYASRLPEQCKTLSRKLGGPVSSSPKRPALTRQKSAPEKPKAAKGQVQRPQRSLQRVLTDEKATAKVVPRSLSRAKSVSVVPNLKRESSEPVSLSLLSSSSARGAIQKPKRMDHREIDLDAVAKQHETKLKKMSMLMDQKKELDAAIDALRKPNRELVSKDFADSAAKRAANGNSRKQKDPIRNPLGEGVQVMATPKTNRIKDCGLVQLPSVSARWKPSIEAASPLSSKKAEYAVPSTAPRLRNVKNVITSIDDTPSKSVSRFSRSLPYPPNSTLVSESPFKVPAPPKHVTTPRAMTQFTTPTKCQRRSGPDVRDTIMSTPPVKDTPLQHRADKVMSTAKNSSSVVFSTPVKQSSSLPNKSPLLVKSVSAVNGEGQSIYTQLGWDNDDDDANDEDELAIPWCTVTN